MSGIRSLLLATVVSVCAVPEEATASLIFESFSQTASDVVTTASVHDFELAQDFAHQATTGSDDSMASRSESPESGLLTLAEFFWQTYFSPDGFSNNAGASGSSTTFSQTGPSAICEQTSALSGWMLISWLRRTAFRLTPDAPRSGLMRPPQGHVA